MRTVLLLLGLLVSGQLLAEDLGHVIVEELRSGRVTYEVDGQRKDLDGAIAVLRERAKRTGISPKDDVAFIVASKSLTISQVQALYSTLQAYGFRDVHVFAFDSDRARLQELGFAMQVIPFTNERSQLMRAVGK